jgi:hypothetical protein
LTSGGLGFFAACPAEIRVRRGGRELTFGKQACQPRLVQIPVSLQRLPCRMVYFISESRFNKWKRKNKF